MSPALAFARGLFQLLSNSHLPREVFTVQNMGWVAHNHPLSVQTQNVTEVSYLLLSSATNGAADAPRGRKGWIWPFWTKLSTRTLRLLWFCSHFLVICSVLQRCLSSGNRTVLWFWKELSSIQIIYFPGHESSIKLLKSTGNVFLMRQESPMK